jgi:TetR/AcrR family transcriptional regulator, fatty acid metabolism regulator protein
VTSIASGTEAAVLDSARRCFTRYGFKKTSMDNVASEARVAKGTVYLYCDNKHDLFYRAIEAELLAFGDELRTVVDPDRPADEILAELGRRDAAFVESHPLVADLLSGMVDGELPEFRDRFAALRKKSLEYVVEVLELGIQQGVFADDLDVRATARILREMQLAGSLLRHRTELPVSQVRRQQRAALRLVMKGLERR